MDSEIEILQFEVAEKEKNCLKDFKKRLKKHSKELDNFNWLLDDTFLLHFIRGKKYNMDKAEKALKQYFHIRHQYKPLFLEMADPESSIALKNEAVSILKSRDEQDRVIIVLKFSRWASDDSIEDFTTAMVLAVEECWHCPKVEREGLQLVVDFTGFGWDHFKMFTPFTVYKCVNIFWSNMPLRYKNVHLVNSGNLVEMLLNALKYVLPSTLRERLVIHSHYDELHKMISSEILPTSLGGEMAEDEAYDKELIERIYRKGEHYQRIAQCL